MSAIIYPISDKCLQNRIKPHLPARDGMLAAMVALALAAHSASHKPPPFSTAFYSVIATVIPVLFLAIAVQGDTYRQMMNSLAGAYAQADKESKVCGHWLRFLASTAAWGALLFASGAILFAGISGEILALASLYRGYAGAGTGGSVLALTIVLLAGVAAPPAASLGMFLLQVIRIIFSRGAPAEDEPEDEPPGETGKTDAG